MGLLNLFSGTTSPCPESTRIHRPPLKPPEAKNTRPTFLIGPTSAGLPLQTPPFRRFSLTIHPPSRPLESNLEPSGCAVSANRSKARSLQNKEQTSLKKKTATVFHRHLSPRGANLKKKHYLHTRNTYLFLPASEEEKLVEEEGEDAGGGNLVTRRHRPGRISIRRTCRERHPFRKWLFQTRWAI